MSRDVFFSTDRRPVEIERTELPEELRLVVVPDVAAPAPEPGRLRRPARPLQQPRPLRGGAEGGGSAESNVERLFCATEIEGREDQQRSVDV